MSRRNHVSPAEGTAEEEMSYGSWKVSKTETTPHKEKKSQLIIKEKREKADKFDAFYRHLGAKCKREEKRIDFVLVHPDVNLKEVEDEDDRQALERRNELREKFETGMKEAGLLAQRILIDDKYYTKIHCPFRRLCEEAETVSLEMPLTGCESEHKDTVSKFNTWVHKTFVTDNEVDMVSAPFLMERMHLYENFDDPTNFFRPSIRSLLVEHLLINIDLRQNGISGRDKYKHANQNAKTLSNCWGCLKEDNEELGDMQKVGLDYMMLEEVYTNKFILHEESQYDPDAKSKVNEALPTDVDSLKFDPRFDMQLTWSRFFKFQPLWKIRNYFGEKIAFYFAWSGTLISTLWLPMLFGFAVFIYGLVESVGNTNDNDGTNTSNSTLTDLFRNVKGSFDNDVTPYFAMFMCIWGTLFLEIWKRKQSELAYQWDVEQFEETEPDRPEFYGTKQRKDPVTNEMDWYYPFKRRAWKLLISSLTLLFMMSVVIVSVLAVIVYRVIATVDYCPNMPDSECLFVSTIVSSLLNAISILILGKLYDIMAYKLTDWENHRTQTQYNDALIIKLFAFQFVNNYASCFYIAFFRGRSSEAGILGKGTEYTDSCEGTCMSQLSFQVMILMITKPIPKFLTDVILPKLMVQFKKRCGCCACIPCLKNILRPDVKPQSEKTLLEIEIEKPSLGNFTLTEYTEKVIQYGLMMLFAASFPLAPLLALCFLMLDLRIDARRMLWWFQRPSAIIAEDIGTWYVILTFLNYIGVVTNAFLIGFTSAWGANYSTAGKLWIVVGFEHIVFTLKFLVAYLIPDTPSSVQLAIRKKRFQLRKKIEEDKLNPVDFLNVTRTTYETKIVDDGPRQRTTKSNFVTEVDTDTRKHRKHKKDKDHEKNGKRDESPPNYSRRLMPGKSDKTAAHLDWTKDDVVNRPISGQKMRPQSIDYGNETYHHM